MAFAKEMNAARKLLILAAIACGLFAMLGLQAKHAFAASAVTATFTTNNGTGYPDVFGGGINTLNNPMKLDVIKQSGTNYVRRDAYLGEILPNTTVAAYLASMQSGTGVANPATWDWSKYDPWVNDYYNRGIKILMIMSYNTGWLSYDGTWWSPPTNWVVYEDVIKKIYQRYQGKVGMVEIWNEPDHPNFMHMPGGPYTDRLTAYKDIYYHAALAIRSVDASVPIGGPVVSNPSFTNWGTALFQDSRITSGSTSSLLNFLSYHHYYSMGTTEAVTNWKNVATNYNAALVNFPVYITEWNWDWQYIGTPLNNDHPDAISFDAKRLTDFYKLKANGANIFADNDQVTNSDFFGVYVNGTQTPKSNTFRLLSKDLGLGTGNSTIRGISFSSPVTNAAAATNSNGDHVAWVVNDGTSPIEIDMNLAGLGAISSVKANIFEASAANNAKSALTTVPLSVSGGNAILYLSAPAKSVVGVLLTPYVISNTTNLAASATATVSSSSGGSALNINDGIIGIKDWASNGQLTPWTQLTWTGSQTIGKVVLYDRSNSNDRINAGTLTFSDGSSVNVPALPNDGTGKSIYFPSKTVTWMKFQVTNGAGANVGLSEIQAYRGSNIAPTAILTASTQMNTSTNAHSKATDGVIGQSVGEWASTEVNPWIQLNWLNGQTINEVVLYDRSSTTINVNGGTLTFSDGSSIAVSGIPTNGTAKVVSFADKSISWVKFQGSGGSGSNVGLSEIQVFQSANLAGSAAVTASSQSADPKNGVNNATDGVINQWYSGEWASNGQTSPWIQLNWPNSQSIKQVVLYDRPNMTDSSNGGTLTFSDGSSIAVSGIDNSGIGKVVTFSAKLVNWVRFQASGSGANVGLAEIEVFGKDVSGGRVFEAEGAGASHQIGRTDGIGWSASTTLDNGGYVLYGPYWSDVAAGNHNVVFRMMEDNNTANNDAVVRIDVHDATSNTVLAQRNITRQEFISANTYMEFPMSFSSIAGHELEFRAYWYDTSYINVDKITLDPS